jgi:hypothetical protein
MVVSGQLHVPVALPIPPSGKEPPVPIVQEDGWGPELILKRRKISYPYQEITHDSSDFNLLIMKKVFSSVLVILFYNPFLYI